MFKTDKLVRYPKSNDPSLQAWDASDQLLTETLINDIQDLHQKKILIINDSFGAISAQLQQFNPQIYVDSFNSAKAIEENLSSTIKIEMDLEKIKDIFDLVIIKIPKNMSFLEDILIHVSRLMTLDSKLVCSSMIKHLPKKSFELINEYIGVTQTSLAKKKARLIYANFEKKQSVDKYPLEVKIKPWEHSFINHSNLFSREKLDIGTRFFLENIPNVNASKILDLGCANGIIGLRAKQLNPNSKLIFTDESFMAIKSVSENYANNFQDEAEFIWTNCYTDPSLPKVDLVLCNPPFHQGNTIGDYIALQMFKDSKRSLEVGGKLIVIGNKHLGYHVRMKKLFGNVRVVNQNKKFIILESIKSL